MGVGDQYSSLLYRKLKKPKHILMLESETVFAGQPGIIIAPVDLQSLKELMILIASAVISSCRIDMDPLPLKSLQSVS